MDDAFIENLSHVLESEGGYSNRPHCEDSGGATKFGITQRVYSAWLTNRGALVRNVLQIRMSEAEEIFFNQYWKAIRGPSLPRGPALAIFDFAVHSGVSLASRKVQKVLDLPMDGMIGEVTLHAIISYPDHERLINRICDLRLEFLKQLSTFKYNSGWISRIRRVRESSIKMISSTHNPAQRYKDVRDVREAHHHIAYPEIVKASSGKAVAASRKIYSTPVAKSTGALVATTPFLALVDVFKDYLNIPYGGCYLIAAAVISIIFYYVAASVDETMV